MYLAGGLAASAHGTPTSWGKMIEGSFAEDGSTGITSAEKEYVHVQGFDKAGRVDRGTLGEQTDSVRKSMHCWGLPEQHSSVR